MDAAATPQQQPVDTEVIAGQTGHWAATFAANPDMYGTDPSAPGLAAAETFMAAGLGSVLELGAGQGRDTLYLARRGLQVTAFDYAPGTIETISAKVDAAGLTDLVTVARHDVRQPLPLPDASVDACYSHMLFCMALTTSEARTPGQGSPPRSAPRRIGCLHRPHHGRRPLRRRHAPW